MKPAQPAPRRTAIRIVLECAIVFAILASVDIGLLKGDAFSSVNPNPLWIPVLLMALAYGTEAGLAATLVASTIWLIACDGRTFPGDRFEQLLAISMPPLLWYLAAIGIGEVTHYRNRRSTTRLRARRRAELKLAKLAAVLRRLDLDNRTLQQRIAADERTVNRALRLAAELQMARPDERQERLRELLRMAIGTDHYTCFLVRGTATFPILEGDRSTIVRPALSSRLMARLREQRGLLLARNKDERDLLAGVGLIALPILSPRSRDIIAVLVIRDIAFERLTDQFLADLSDHSAWLGSHLSSQFAEHEADEESIVA
ncbi:hypothetical protein [Novosphingobium cyanobacteriorum]|uniref:GAF domain-containing protein n=1 Tax=Novosphingobium cyanobacteriorum TaxID=3024215 RepID=A0ABT6CNP1_9SPHN|nr:hypothetical protein [Novosphingobium cyanobacteriorum]MDF8335533.1 hypothetical protein [Novosphingobium cyanobacteriorum]